jgi:hypothetical protein
MSKILILFTISAIQMVLFVFVANSVLGIKDMYFEFWIALFSISAFANILGLIISASFNSIITIYILIPLLMIPQMVLGGAMFTFDKLNKDFTSPDVVPAIAEFMPSRWIYEGLMVHQYKHNNFKKNIFEVEMRESAADFKQVYYIPELRDIIAETEGYVEGEENISREQYESNIRLIYNEVSNELRRVPSVNFDKLDKITPEGFSAQLANEINDYLDRLLGYYQDEFYKANTIKEQFLSANIEANREKFERIRDDYFNESINDIVRKVFDKNKILREDDHLIQMVDPVYQKPEPLHFFDFRTHFFAPSKHFAGHYFETLWFNIVMVWVLTILLYIVLYFDLLKKGLNFAGNLKWIKRKDK